jgi:hypothetical protein
MAWILHQDEVGTYTELRAVFRRHIDACLLRTSNKIYNMGIDLLYRSNNFHFIWESETWTQWTLQPGAEQPYQPNDCRLQSVSRPDTRQAAWIISQITNRATIEELDFWAYFDPFLRFLYTIGSENAGRMKHVTFSGTVVFHNCRIRRCHPWECGDNLVILLQNHIPFLNALCPLLEKLTIRVWQDWRHATTPGMPATAEEALSPIFENQLRGLPSLRKVELQGWRETDCQGLEFADKTNTWLAEREANRKSD